MSKRASSHAPRTGSPGLAGASVLITGGTGTFGTAMLTRLVADPGLHRIIVFSRDEYKQAMLARRFSDPRISYFLGDVRDKDRLLRAFNGVDVVIHAAALKQVPAIEYNPNEAIATNVVGTQNVISAALDKGVGRVMVISSDKAVQPINLYGATKMCAERVAIASNAYRGTEGVTRISAMRYGNVLGSRGSVVELIEAHKTSGAAIPVTDVRMTRFWIQIEEVIDITLEAIGRMEGGEIFVPKMRSARLLDLIEALAPKLATVVVGMRPGEKLHETLITEYEVPRTKELERMYAVLPEAPAWEAGSAFAAYPRYSGSGLVSNGADALLTDPAAIAALVVRA